MKNKIILLFLIGSMFAGCGGCGNEVKAQTVTMKTFTTGTTTDVIGNSSVDTLVCKVSNGWRNISIQVLYTNTGILCHDSSTSSSKIYGSLDGINFKQIGSTTFTTSKSVCITASGPFTYIWSLANDNYLWYAVINTAGGVDSSTVSAKLTARQALGISGTAAGLVNMLSSNVVSANNDSIKNQGVDTMSQSVAYSHNSISVQPVLTKVSGTVLAGVQLQVSEDGINFVNIAGDSLHCTNISTPQTTIWNVPASTEQHYWYRTLTTGYGATQVATIKVLLLGK